MRRLPPAGLLLSALIACASPATAQTPAGVPTSRIAFDRFLRVVDLLGGSVAALSARWPSPINVRAASHELVLSASHLVVVQFDGTAATRDSASALVQNVRFIERFGDTLTLRRRTLEIMAALGAADRCDTPLGPPGYLFAPQRVARHWRRGIDGKPTTLVWEVAAGPSYSLTVDVGRRAEDAIVSLACDARLP